MLTGFLPLYLLAYELVVYQAFDNYVRYATDSDLCVLVTQGNASGHYRFTMSRRYERALAQRMVMINADEMRARRHTTAVRPLTAEYGGG